MPRRSRCLLPEVACHITQRGVDRRETFCSDADRTTYLTLLSQNLTAAEVRLLGWCLMSNHVHLIAVPAREDSLSVLLRRVHGRYSQYFNARAGRSGHLWQNRYFACLLDTAHLWAALAYVERNPVRAGMVARATQYRWSSAAAHVAGQDDRDLLDMEWWRQTKRGDWEEALNREDDGREVLTLRQCTYSGKPFATDTFVEEVGRRFGRQWVRGRPRNDGAPAGAPAGKDSDQPELF